MENVDLVSILDQFSEKTKTQEDVTDYIVKLECFSDLKKVPEWVNRVTPKTRKGFNEYFTEQHKIISPWVFFVLAKFIKLHPVTIQRILALYATNIKFRKDSYLPGKPGMFQGEFYRYGIDPRYWFGILAQREDMPDEYVKMFCDRFAELQSEYDKNTIFIVQSCGRVECQLPDNFTYRLMKYLVTHKIFVDVDFTCPAINPKNPFRILPGYYQENDIRKLMEEAEEIF
jgi:hypothetical protein